MLLASLLVAAIGGSVPAANAMNPLALAEKGLWQCWRPNFSSKTCRVIASYRKTGPERYDNTAILALSTRGPVTVETHSLVVVRGGSVCGAVRTQDIEAGIVRNGARIVASADAQPILEQVAQIMAPLNGQETCTRYERSGPDFIAKISVAGRYRPELDTKVKWISSADGYTVTP